MANYYRITAYHKEKDFSIIMDSYGLFEKKWQFSADLIRKGFDIIEVSDFENVIDIDISKLDKPMPEKYILRASGKGKPQYTEQNINGSRYKVVIVGDRRYVPDENKPI